MEQLRKTAPAPLFQNPGYAPNLPLQIERDDLVDALRIQIHARSK